MAVVLLVWQCWVVWVFLLLCLFLFSWPIAAVLRSIPVPAVDWVALASLWFVGWWRQCMASQHFSVLSPREPNSVVCKGEAEICFAWLSCNAHLKYASLAGIAGCKLQYFLKLTRITSRTSTSDASPPFPHPYSSVQEAVMPSGNSIWVNTNLNGCQGRIST